MQVVQPFCYRRHNNNIDIRDVLLPLMTGHTPARFNIGCLNSSMQNAQSHHSGKSWPNICPLSRIATSSVTVATASLLSEKGSFFASAPHKHRPVVNLLSLALPECGSRAHCYLSSRWSVRVIGLARVFMMINAVDFEQRKWWGNARVEAVQWPLS